MKALLVAEQREGKLFEATYELAGFAAKLGAESAMVLVGDPAAAPPFGGKVYLADAERYGEYNPDLHRQLVLTAVEKEDPDYIVFLHTSYGWDLAPRVAARLKCGQVSEVVAITEDGFETGACNGKMRRAVKTSGSRGVITIQLGAFSAIVTDETPSVIPLEGSGETRVAFAGYQPAEAKTVDLGRADIIVSAGRGIGKQENVEVIAALARALGGELAASRPVVDAGWVDHSRQVGTTGQSVSPKLYIACGISGAIQHLAGMKRSGFVVAINKDKEAPIGEIADVLVVADVIPLVQALTAKVGK
ncbi:electron transfer flavoprotein subunit alpha/FixB family protein [Geomonas sp. RF6]|uniref:electron transfer flavoprotein subunit alpha/FixB family protein n=1 Tax=Geomonas sp. RF6 TaxID=2897342 RepID=UPI001E5819F8|nr:electron transfer flavoprotein subunit alpha/FixB family protein [Geomonas sp. RF6]UFS70020.1 electron transfer flavoprotein subunit alpha/FixB family protein [Geomonas sp. RF6]